MAVPTSDIAAETIQSQLKRSLYENSTQHRHWKFSPESLHSIRTTQNQRAVTKIQNAFENDSPGSSSSIEFLSADEEHALVKVYITKVGQLCGHFRFPEEVEATAVSYLKRFYLRNTVMDYHPKNVMLTALFLAAKTCNQPISIERYVSHIPKTSPSDVLDLEFLVAQSLRFEFTIWHAHRALWGLWLDMQSLPSFPMDTAQDLFNAAIDHVRISRLTDVELIFPPSQISLACMHMVLPIVTEEWAISKDMWNDSLKRIIEQIQEVIHSDGGGPEIEFVRQIDKRLKICMNPEKVVGSKAYLQKQAEAEALAAKKRLQKADEVKLALAKDPFGASLEEGTPHAVPGIFHQTEKQGVED